MSRTYRKPYSGSKAFDVTCRSHGSCGYCEGSRRHRSRRHEAADEKRQIRNGYLGYDPEQLEEDIAELRALDFDIFGYEGDE